jgi:hypothetical protein
MIKSFAEIDRYKIVLDESWEHERNRDYDAKIWYELIPIRIKGGMVYLQTTTSCAAFVPSIGVLNNLSAALTTANIPHKLEKLDGEGLICFGLHDLKKAAKIFGAKRRKTLTEEQKKKAIANLSPFKPKHVDNGHEKLVKIDDQEKVIAE